MQIFLFCDYRGYANSKYESLFLALEESHASVAKKPDKIRWFTSSTDAV